MALDIERASARDLDDIATPQSFRAVELDIASAPAQPMPRLHGQVLHPPHSYAAIDRNTLRLHEAVVEHWLASKLAKPPVLAGLGFMPVRLIRIIVHGVPLRRLGSLSQSRSP